MLCWAPVKRWQFGCLLCAGQLQQLLSLPWAGVLTLEREKLSEPVPVVEVGL
jgi:hypothetical protein